MTIFAMRNDMHTRQQKKYNNDSKKTRFATHEHTIKNKNPKSDAKIKRNQNPKTIPKAIPKMTPKSKKISTHVTQTSNNVASQIPSEELDYYNVRIFVLKYFLDHNRDLNNETTLQILDKTIHKILKHLNEEQQS